MEKPPVPLIRKLILAAILAMCATISGAQTITDKARRDEVVKVPQDDPDMAAAMRNARATLPNFLALARAPGPSMTGFSVKVAVSDGGLTEYFWVIQFESKDGQYSGRVNNRPRTVHNVAFGQVITFPESDIVDWIYLDGKKMKGGYTTCALVKRESREQANAFAKQYGLDCSF
ncbi:MAG: DUF2314 domain-containing protein [Xanthobacteraceae bacterium]